MTRVAGSASRWLGLLGGVKVVEFVGQPLRVAAVAVVFLIGFLALRVRASSGSRNPRALLVAAAAWLVYAAWEWLVQVRTPEANMST